MTITALMPVYPRCGVRPVRGEGCYLISEDGSRYLDMAAGIAGFDGQHGEFVVDHGQHGDIDCNRGSLVVAQGSARVIPPHHALMLAQE